MSRNDIPMTFDVPYFTRQTIMNGGKLLNHPACHALWMFYLMAMQANEEKDIPVDEQIVLEGEPWTRTNYEQQARSIALWYGVTYEEMSRMWEFVDDECVRMGLPRCPDRIRNLERDT